MFMSRIETLKEKVSALYQSKNPSRADWADWMFENHVFVVANKAGELAKRYGANADLAEAAGMLHDIADAVMLREDKRHEEESHRIARKLLEESGFFEEEIKIIVDDAIMHHACHGDDQPQTLEGKVMATADALAHLETDFYNHALQILQKDLPNEEIKQWALPKIERDYRKKIFFGEVRKETTPAYEKSKALFS
jgi:putative nucleotidyltransferase with HDIG domain